jgi:hypothetical protein
MLPVRGCTHAYAYVAQVDPGNEKKESMFQVGSIWGFSRSWDLEKVGCAEKSWCESVNILWLFASLKVF